MAYRLDLSEAPADSLRRAVAERIEDARRQLDDEIAHDPRTAVHEARKDIKKSRSLLRLYRGALERETYRGANRTLRDAGRELAAMRDADVLVDTVDALAERFAGREPEAVFDGLRECARERGGDGAGAEPVEAARARLADVLSAVGDWGVTADDARALVAGIARAYARGRDACARARAAPTDERLHDWRKRVKDLRYQQQLLRDAWPEVIGAQARAAKDLSDLLGDDHDLAVLRARVGDAADDELLELVARRRAELQAAAFRLGRRVYAESPKRFARRMRTYLETA